MQRWLPVQLDRDLVGAEETSHGLFQVPLFDCLLLGGILSRKCCRRLGVIYRRLHFWKLLRTNLSCEFMRFYNRIQKAQVARIIAR